MNKASSTAIACLLAVVFVAACVQSTAPKSSAVVGRYSGYVNGGYVSFVVTTDTQAIEPGWEINLASGWSEAIPKEKANCSGGTAPDEVTKRFEQTVPIANGEFEYTDTVIRWRGEFSVTHIVTGTLELTNIDTSTTCIIGPLDWMAVPWPKTVDEAVKILMNILSDEDKEYLRTLPEKDIGMLHMGLGMWIRNTFGLWGGNSDLLTSCGSPDMHPDNCSGIIIGALVKSVKGEK